MLDDSTQLPIVTTDVPAEAATGVAPPWPSPSPSPGTDESPVPPTASAHAPSSRHRWWAVPLAAAGFLVPLVMVAASFVLVDAYADAPGSADDVESRIEFGLLPDGVTVDDSDGEILFVTVSGPHLNALQRRLAKGDDDIFVETYEKRFGSRTPTQEREIALQMMRDAKDVAEFVAYRRLGFGGELMAGEVVVAQILCLNGTVEGDPACEATAPAGEFLERGATITAVDGTPTPTLDDLSPIMKTHAPGDVITVRYRPPKATEELEASFATFATPDEPARALIGFVPHDTYSVELPFEAEIDTDRIGGPSAGLAFTLTLIDSLTAGSLTGGQEVAVTGTISDDGTVGAIGGLHQKIIAAKQAGADYFIVPNAQGEEGDNGLAMARRVAGDDLDIVPVTTFEAALAALLARGGDPLPPAPAVVVAEG